MALSPLDIVPMPARIANLPRDHRGYPVPYFVEWLNGKPQFPIASPVKWARCVGKRLCWVCGEPLGRSLVFAIGPMGTVNQVSAEPPAHRECTLYAMQVCPFLINPRMGRVPTERLGEAVPPGGVWEPANPGVMAAWSTRSYSIVRTATGPIISVGDPFAVEWWTRGRVATAQEAADAFTFGATKLLTHAQAEGRAATLEIGQLIITARKRLPDPDLVTEIVGE
jgi:hypothetical protein